MSWVSLKIISYMLKHFFEILRFVLGILNFQNTLQNSIKWFVLNNNLPYAQLFLFFFYRKTLILITIILTLFSFYSSERFLYLPWVFFSLFSFSSTKRFDTFQVLLCEAFLFFHDIYDAFLYMYTKKLYRKFIS